MESRTGLLDDVLNSKLEEALEKQSYEQQVVEIARISSEYNSVDLAYAAARLPLQARLVLFENLVNEDAKVIFLINTDSHSRAFLLRHLDDDTVVKLTQKMPLDEAVWVLDDIPDRRFRKIITLFDDLSQKSIKDLRLQDRHSAARLMISEFCAFKMDTTIGEVAEYIRNHPRIEVTRRIFVLNEQGRLQGFVPARTLIINSSQTPLKHVMRPIVHTVMPEATREEVIDVVERYKIPALPVVDQYNQLVGVITYEDVVEALEDVADETIARMSGTTEHVGNLEPVFQRFLLRAPWLVVTLIAGLVNALGMAFFENREGAILAFVLFFVPLITGMSGNIGIQCSTVIVRGMATGALSKGQRAKAIKREMIIGSCLGIAFGILAGILVYGLDIFGCPLVCMNPVQVGLIVSVGLLGACLCGTLLGVFSPFFFSHVGVDPALASGPIVTALNDFFSMIIYFLISWGLSSLFLL